MNGVVQTRGVVSHPATYFLGAWSLCILLMSIDLIPRITQYFPGAVRIFMLLAIAHLLGVLMAWCVDNRVISPDQAKVRYVFSYRTHMLIFWLVGTVFEIILSGGIPLLWVLYGSAKTYEQFGIPSIHGFMNAIYLFLTMSAFIQTISEKSSRSLVEFLFLLAWSVLAVSRALLTISLLQSATFFLIKSDASLQRKTYTLIGLASGFLVIFGVLGNVRAEAFSILESTGLGDIDPNYSVFVWVYAYLVSPIANLALNIAVNTAELKFIPTTFLLPLLPSALQNALGYETGFYSFSGYLAHDAFNVSTAFIQIFIDWGLGGIMIYDFILGFLGHMVWRGYVKSGRADMLSLFIPCITLTVFSNQFNQLPILLLFLMVATFSRVDRRYSVVPYRNGPEF